MGTARNKVSKRKRAPSTGRRKKTGRTAKAKTEAVSLVRHLAAQALEADVNASLVPSRASRVAVASEVRATQQAASIRWEATPHPIKGYKVAEHDAEYLRPLMAKYGDDYLAMRRDIKLNNWQWSDGQLRKVAEALRQEKEDEKNAQ